jgi:hypothetical protein
MITTTFLSGAHVTPKKSYSVALGDVNLVNVVLSKAAKLFTYCRLIYFAANICVHTKINMSTNSHILMYFIEDIAHPVMYLYEFYQFIIHLIGAKEKMIR